MSDSENNCRICRGEGTPSQPLLHPCKCRGSIRYIHQDCLLEWLKHSNKSTEQCDICNTPYKFRTIYDENMPSKIPIKFIWLKFLQVISSTSIISLSILLYVLCLIFQVPIFWKFIGRAYTYAMDGHLPHVNSTFTEALMFGDVDFSQYDLPPVNTPKYYLLKAAKFFDYTYFSGARYFIVFGFVNLALFIEHEWVVRDEGYTKLLLRKVGKEPRTKLVDMLQQALVGLRNEGANGNEDANANLQRVQELVRAINDLQERQTNGQHEEALRRAINAQPNEDQQEQGPPVLFPQADRGEDEDNDSDLDFDDESRTIFIRPELQNQPQPQNIPEFNPPNDDPPRIVDESSDSESEDENGFNGDAAAAAAADNEAAAAAAANGAGNIFEFLGLSLNLKTPIVLMILCDVIIGVYLFFFYLIPHMLGNAFTGIFGLVIRNLISPIINSILQTNQGKDLVKHIINDDGSLVKTGNDFTDFAVFTITELIIKPVYQIFDDLFLRKISLTVAELTEDFKSLTLVERIISLSIGYCIISYACYKFMKKLISGSKPILGTPRKYFKILFEISSTLKVFLIFAIEIFFFPVYCGWLLDFCAAPLLLPHFTTIDESTGNPSFLLLFTSGVPNLQIHYLRIGSYWALGTLYMLFFALFIGMVRSQILRPGVLFFIRSPDDPNARLIHDALVKPFMLQLSRIYLSAKVYTGFILIGIGGITWGLRYIVTPSNDDNVFLPIQKPNIFAIIGGLFLFNRLMNDRPLITKYCKIYWTRVFEISCHKLRLSHFILGKPIAQERGYIIYRNLWHRFLGVSLPDYSRPVNYKNALRIFKENPEVNACFVPDGNYIRAPDNDTVSRKFIKKLFVPVTKDDKLLESNDTSLNTNGGYETESSDDEINNDNAYTIVYRPPNFKTKCLNLILMLWIFAVILILLILLVALMMGRPVTMFISQVPIIPGEIEKYGLSLDGKLADFGSIFIGLTVLLSILTNFDKKYEERMNQEARGATNPTAAAAREAGPAIDQNDGPANEVGEERNIFDQIRNLFEQENHLRVFRGSFNVTMVTFTLIMIHYYYIHEPISYYRNQIMKSEYFNFLDLSGHVLVFIWTIFPLKKVYDYTIAFLYGDMEAVDEWNSQIFKLMGLTISITLPLYVSAKMTETLVEEMKYRFYFISGLTLIIYTYGGYKILQKLEEQIKNEKYVRGRAIENIDLSDEE